MRRKESWKIWVGTEDMELANLTGMQRHRKTTELAARGRPAMQSRNGYYGVVSTASFSPRLLYFPGTWRHSTVAGMSAASA